MKVFIFSFLLTAQAFAQNEMLTDDELKKKFVASVKDVEIEKMLEKTKEFQGCLNGKKYVEGKDKENDAIIASAEKCFTDNLKGKPADDLKKLSDQLNLESYGLVKSRNVKEITEYLTDKIYKAMTGYSREEKDRQKLIESMKFKNKKMINQSVFIDLYMTQLGKSALQELSRYCFEDLRVDDDHYRTKIGKSYEDYWKKTITKNYKHENTGSDIEFTDDGNPAVGKYDMDQNNKDAAYQQLLENIASTQEMSKYLESHWVFCKDQLTKLCDNFQKNYKSNPKTPGAKSCLVKGKLSSFRNALKNSEAIKEQFNKLDGEGVALMLDKGMQVDFFDPKANEMNSVDNLTSFTSEDLLDGNQKAGEVDELAENCLKRPNDSGCEALIVAGDLKKSEYNISLQMAMKKKVETERVKEILKQKGETLQKYLESNGWFELADKVSKGYTPSEQELNSLIEASYDARKQAAINELKEKVGKRQLKTEDANNKQEKEKVIKVNAEETVSERSRLAQVVMFNNIILSQLNIFEGKTAVGKNTSALQKELSGLDQKGKINSDFFSGLKNYADQNKGTGVAHKSGSLGALDLLEGILGKPKENSAP